MKRLFTELLKSSAFNAVSAAESALDTSSGQAKKEFAIAFLVNSLPIPALLKPFVSSCLSNAIDEAIESAVVALKG